MLYWFGTMKNGENKCKLFSIWYLNLIEKSNKQYELFIKGLSFRVEKAKSMIHSHIYCTKWSIDNLKNIRIFLKVWHLILQKKKRKEKENTTTYWMIQYILALYLQIYIAVHISVFVSSPFWQWQGDTFIINYLHKRPTARFHMKIKVKTISMLPFHNRIIFSFAYQTTEIGWNFRFAFGLRKLVFYVNGTYFHIGVIKNNAGTSHEG